MKHRSLMKDFLHFLVHNSFWVTAVVMCEVHAVLLVLTLCADVTPLWNFNILSVVVYLFCIILCKTGHILPVYISIILEVCSYAFISIYYIGWHCGSYFFLFSIVPIIIYFGCFLFKDAKRWIIPGILILIFALYITLYFVYHDDKPVYDVPTTIRTILLLFSTFVMFFSVVIYNVIYIYSSEFEVSSLETKNEQLSVDAHADALTGLLNRRGFLPMIEELMKDTSNHFCVSFFDIDNFKRVNDTYGHDCGDEVIRHIASIIKKEMHGCGICRWGGEEFIILMKDYDLAVAKQKMEYLRKYIESTPTVFFNKHISIVMKHIRSSTIIITSSYS